VARTALRLAKLSKYSTWYIQNEFNRHRTPGFRTKWLSDARAAAYKDKCKPNMQVGTTPRIDVNYQPAAVSFDGGDTHRQYHSIAQQTPREQKQSPVVNESSALCSGKHHNKPEFYDDIVIELSSDEELLNTSTLSRRYTQAQWGSRTTASSSPCTHRGKKRYREEDVIVISDDEESTSQAKKRHRYPSPTL
jgi:hypothetical protein